jgi:hypothetical protein
VLAQHILAWKKVPGEGTEDGKVLFFSLEDLGHIPSADADALSIWF